MDWIYLIEDRNQWRTPVNTVMSLQVHIKCWEVIE
jgi:hypothetical protein